MQEIVDKKIVILGSTGSVGRQTVEVAKDFESRGVRTLALAGSKNVKIMEREARLLRPRFCVMTDEAAAQDLKTKLADTDIEVRAGKEALLEAASLPDADIVYNSIGQSAGLEPTLSALRAGKTLALANKESLVIAGEIVKETARRHNAQIIPVDSEHCAIYQCLRAGRHEEISRIILTASGGPFFGMKRDEMSGITPERALAHPTWNMGPKITVDSATLMNKGFEVIEAVHLFDVQVDQIEVAIHRESIIHSAVEYNDNAVIAQLSVPDMKLCAQYALTCPERLPGPVKRLELADIGKMTFYKPDFEAFPLLALAIDCIKRGGVLPAALNAADEVAVSQFLDGYIGFTDIMDVVDKTISKIRNIYEPDLTQLKEASDEAMLQAAALCKSLRHR